MSSRENDPVKWNVLFLPLHLKSNYQWVIVQYQLLQVETIFEIGVVHATQLRASDAPY